MTCGFGGVHRVNHGLGHVVALGVHHVGRGVVLGDQAEGVDAYLKLDAGPVDALVAQARDELGREVQARGGRGRRVLFLHGVDRLVLLGVALVAGDIGRQGHVARGMNGLVKRVGRAVGRRAHGIKAHQAPALGALDKVDDRARQDHRRRVGRVQPARAVLDHGARLLQALAGVDQAFPHMPQRVEVFSPLEQQGLGDAAGAALLAHQTRRHDAGLVGNQQVAGLKQVKDVVEVLVRDVAGLAVKHKQAARVARLGRGLGNKLVWQGVIKVVGAHSCPLRWVFSHDSVARMVPRRAMWAQKKGAGLFPGSPQPTPCLWRSSSAVQNARRPADQRLTGI